MKDGIVTKISVEVCQYLGESVANRVIEVGIPGVQLVDGENSVIVTTYVDNKESAEYLIRDLSQFLDSLKEIFPEYRIGPLEVSDLESVDWAHAWKKYFHAFKVTENIVIKPTWEDYIPADQSIVIEIDPEMAFGTGSHETTRLCILKLESLSNQGSGLHGKTVLDIGTGTGILSIVAAKLGAKKAIGIDTDPHAVQTAIINSKRNNIIKLCEFSNLSLSKLGTFDIIVANINSETLCDLSENIANRQNSGGSLILSGIIHERKDEMIEAFRKVGYSHFKVDSQGEWISIESVRCP